jgi:hypothetical protein
VTVNPTGPSPRATDTHPLWSRRVVVVEPDGMLRTRIAGTLLRSGVQVRACFNADCATRAIDEWRPHLLLTNASLGSDTDGVSLASEFAARAPHLRVIVLHDEDESMTPVPDDVAGRTTVVPLNTVTSASVLLDLVCGLLAGVPTRV